LVRVDTWYRGHGNAGLVAGDMAMLIHGDPRTGLAGALWPAVVSGELSAVLAQLATQGLERLPDFAMAIRRGNGVLVLCRGMLSARVLRGDVLIDEVRADTVTTWREAMFEDVDRVILAAGSDADLAGGSLPLLGGIVGASRLEMIVHSMSGGGGAPVTREWMEPQAKPLVPEPLRPITALFSQEAALPVPAPLPKVAEAANGPAWNTPAQSGRVESPAPSGLPNSVAGTDGALLDRLSWLDAEPQAEAAAPVSSGSHFGDTVSRGQVPETSVAAVRCPKLHLNPPATPACRECLLPLDPTQEPFFVAQPVVGRLRRLDTDEDWPLSKKVIVLGRSPAAAGLSASADLQLVAVNAVSPAVCDVHAEVRLRGWRLEVVDRSDRGGTMVTNPGDQPVRLEPGVPMRLLLGGQIQLADEVSFVFGL
jgi:hypothetical protein